MATTFQPFPESGARLFVPAPVISQVPTGDCRYAFELWLRRRSGRDYLVHSVSFTSSAPLWLDGMEGTPAFTATLLPAMRLGLPLEVEGPVSPRLLEGAREFQDVFSTWMDGLQRIEIEATASGAPATSLPPERGVASFFSGGVDGFHTLQRNLERVTHLIYIHGFDIESDRIAHRMAVEDAVANLAAELNCELVVVQTDVRGFSDSYLWWGDYCGSVLGTSAQLMQGIAHTVLVAASNTYEGYRPFGTSPLTDRLFSTEHLDVVHEGADVGRVEKVGTLAEWELAMRHLRVCWSMHGTSLNCGECPKCLWTMTALFLVGALHRAPTFPGPLDVARVAHHRLEPWHVQNVGAILDAARERGLEDTPLMQAWQDCLSRAGVRVIASRHELHGYDRTLRDAIHRELPPAFGRWFRRPGRWLKTLRWPSPRHLRALWYAMRGR